MASFIDSSHVKGSRLVAIGHSGGATALYESILLVFVLSLIMFLACCRSSFRPQTRNYSVGLF